MLYVVIGLMGVLTMWPDLPLSRSLHRTLVAEPVRRMSSLTRVELIAAVILLLFLSAGAEMIVMLGSVEMASALALQVALYADAVTVSLFAALLTRIRPLATLIRAGLGASPRRSQRRRRAVRKTSSPAANDDDPAPLRRFA